MRVCRFCAPDHTGMSSGARFWVENSQVVIRRAKMPQDLKAVQTAYCESHVTLFARSAKFALRYSIQLLNIWLVGLAIAAVAALVLRRSQWVDNCKFDSPLACPVPSRHMLIRFVF